MKLIPKNWETFQHYKDRSPTWVKLHKNLLDDMAFQRLPVGARALAPMLWLLASESVNGVFNGSIEELSFRLRQSEKEISVSLDALIQSGFFVVYQDASNPLADCYKPFDDVKQVASLEKRRERERERERGEKEESEIPASLLADFLAVRTAKKAGPLTKTALAGIAREADKAGITLIDAVTACCEYGWQGFNAAWFKERRASNTKVANSSETAYQRSMRERVAEFSPSIAKQAPGTYPIENMILEAENVVAIAGH